MHRERKAAAGGDLQAVGGAIEFKFGTGAEALPEGEFRGYGAVFGNVDSHGDVILPGAFKANLAMREVEGRKLPMHAMHGGGMFGGGLPIGVWKGIAEDEKGLRVHGKISGMNTDEGRLNWERLKDGAYGGLSIGYRPVESIKGKGAVKRQLKTINLFEISLVDDPSNALALVDEMKRAHKSAGGDTALATASVAAAMRLHDQMNRGHGKSSGAKDQARLMDHLRDAHAALTGTCAPADLQDWKLSVDREAFEAKMRETFDISEDQARELADRVFDDPKPNQLKSCADFDFLSNFKLPAI